MTSRRHALPDLTQQRVLIAGVSTRAFALSAVAAGYSVVALDGYGDLDLCRHVTAFSLSRDFGVEYGARALVSAAQRIDCDAVSYTSNLENHPAQVLALTRGRSLWGNTPDTLRRVRDPLRLSRLLRRRGFAAPRTRSTVPASGDGRRAWLRKPRASGGGQGITPWRGGAPGRHGVLQERIRGTPGSITFAADGHRAVPLTLTQQLIGDPNFGARPFRYCGSILASAGDPAALLDDAELETAIELAQVVTEEFELVGVNGIDFMAHRGVPWPIEVNPRPTASMELLERWHAVSVFATHVQAVHGSLPSFDLRAGRRKPGAVGKAVLYAPRALRLGDTRPWLIDQNIRDIPHPGERISRGAPLCTVFAVAPDAASCYAALVQRAKRLYSECGPTRRSA